MDKQAVVEVLRESWGPGATAFERTEKQADYAAAAVDAGADIECVGPTKPGFYIAADLTDSTTWRGPFSTWADAAKAVK